METNWGERLILEYALQAVGPELGFLERLADGGSRFAHEAQRKADASTRQMPYGDIYFVNGHYHVGEPDLTRGSRSYQSGKPNGELASGEGKVLTYMLLHVNKPVPTSLLYEITSWQEVDTNMSIFDGKLRRSTFFTLKTAGDAYMLETNKTI